jgi:hypothetical protein
MDWTVTIDLSPDAAGRALDVLRRLRPHRIAGKDKLRVGRFNDGGYVMIDDFDGIQAAYSLGINDDVSWDRDVAQLGIPVFQYDHTIPGLPEQHPLFNWKPICISGLPKGSNEDSLENLMIKNGHDSATDLLLKCDIEKSEYLLLDQTPNTTLRRFRQIVIELHELSFLADPHHGENVRRALTNLTASHHVVHVHANNYAPFMTIGGLPIPNVVELTLVRKDRGVFTASDESFPGAWDMPCNPAAADLYLGRFVFD